MGGEALHHIQSEVGIEQPQERSRYWRDKAARLLFAESKKLASFVKVRGNDLLREEIIHDAQMAIAEQIATASGEWLSKFTEQTPWRMKIFRDSVINALRKHSRRVQASTSSLDAMIEERGENHAPIDEAAHTDREVDLGDLKVKLTELMFQIFDETTRYNLGVIIRGICDGLSNQEIGAQLKHEYNRDPAHIIQTNEVTKWYARAIKANPVILRYLPGTINALRKVAIGKFRTYQRKH